MDLFVYGTLMDPQLVEALTGRRFSSRPAVLPDFRRIEEPGHYPFIEACVGEKVDGMLLLDVDDATIAVLDEYEAEGALYLRRSVSVIDENGISYGCVTYVGIREAVLATERKSEADLARSGRAT